jgi:hypothetical protein
MVERVVGDGRGRRRGRRPASAVCRHLEPMSRIEKVMGL